MITNRISGSERVGREPNAGELSAPQATIERLCAKYGLSFIRDLQPDLGVGTSTHLVRRGNEELVLKALTPDAQCGGERMPVGHLSIGLATLRREDLVLRAELPGLPQHKGTLVGEDGNREAVLRSFHPGSSVVDLVQQSLLKDADFERALRALLEKADARGFRLLDTDASNFIVAAEYSIVNPYAVHRTLMLIDPEALSPRSEYVEVEGRDPVQDVMNSLRAKVAAPNADRLAA